MKNTLQVLLLSLLIISCKKPQNGGETIPSYLGGRVVLINSDTPVPHALVRFLKWAPNPEIFDPPTYVLVASDTTDESGRFDIPVGTDATMAIAYGPNSIYAEESTQVDVEAYLRDGGEMKLQLIPPACIKVSAVDIEPFNPEVLYVHGDTNIASSDGLVNLSAPITWKVQGNVPQYIKYLLILQNGEYILGNYNITGPTPFDTTTHIITY